MPNHKEFNKNTEGRDFIIGDLHGCFDELEYILKERSFNYQKDRLFSTGDLIDRGPRSMDCLWLINQDWFHAVRGNHEQLMIDAILHNQDKGLWVSNGGAWHIYEDQKDLKALVELSNELPYSINIETTTGLIGICHAQPPTGDWKDVEHPTSRDKANMLWNRSWIENEQFKVHNNLLARELKNVMTSYHGHTIVPTSIKLANVHFIDTGSFLEGGYLTCIQIQ